MAGDARFQGACLSTTPVFMSYRKFPILCIQVLAFCIAAVGGHAQTPQTNSLASLNPSVQSTNRYDTKSGAVRSAVPPAQVSTNEDAGQLLMKEATYQSSMSGEGYSARVRKPEGHKRIGEAKAEVWKNLVQQFNPMGTPSPSELEMRQSSLWKGMPGGCPPPRFSTDQGYHDEGGLVLYAH
jgi:hypothetical protein